MKQTIVLLVALLFLSLQFPITHSTGRQNSTIAVQVEQDEVPKYGVAELTITYSGPAYPNPWEGPQIVAMFTSPANHQIQVGGFYYSANLWKVRLAPDEPGTWSWSLEWRDGTTTQQASGLFRCVPSAGHGFVRHHPTDPFRLIFEDGSLYPAIGLTDCILDSNGDGTPLDDFGLDGGFRPPGDHSQGQLTDMATYLNAYSAAGFNLFRWSVDNCSFKLWDSIDPAGNKYLEAEGKFGDALLTALRARGFRVFMTIFHVPVFSGASGDSAKMAAVTRYVKYVVDRYGAYVDFWELMNESPSAQNPVDEQWYGIVTDYLQSVDPYAHMVSTNFPRPDLDEININSIHWYEKEDASDSDIETRRRIVPGKQIQKPIIFSEQGNTGQNWDPDSALRMRIRSWTAFFSEATLIFWNTSGFKDFVSGEAANIYLGPEERGYIRVLQDFASQADADIQPVPLAPERALIRGYGLMSNNMLLGYFHHPDHHIAVGSALAIEIPKAGTAYWIDPASGHTVRTDQLSSGRLIIDMPPVQVDLALRIEFEAPPRQIATVSAASFTSPVALESIVAAFGSGLGGGTGTQVAVDDGSGNEKPAQIFFASPSQVNFQIPQGVATGTATVMITNDLGVQSQGSCPLTRIAPGLFSANGNGSGVAAGVALRVKADGSQSFEPIAEFDSTHNQWVARPIDLGPSGENVYLILFGTGCRFRRASAAATARIGGVDAPIVFDGPQGFFAGLDQVNLLLPRALTGRGSVDVTVAFEREASNLVEVSIH
jgi:uncharacterized protein (TIGR03437 family)